MRPRFSVIGLGKLGASMAAAIASRGFEVIGVDVNQKAVDAVNAGRAPVQETDLESLIQANQERLRATDDHEEAILGSDVSFVVVPTPSDERGAFSLQYATWAFQEIGKALAKKSGYHNVVLTSTVLPGATRSRLLPTLEEASGKRGGEDFGLCYSPEFIALGSIIADYLHPDFILLGELDERCGAQLADCFAQILPEPTPCRRMSLENAELAKVAINTYITTKITFANTLAEICQTLPGGDVDVVSDAIGLDKRIGRAYLTGALGYGGPCFPRDNVALSWFAEARGATADLATTTDRHNRSIAGRVARRIGAMLRPGDTVAVLGLSYKPHSHVTEEAQGVELARTLALAGFRVIGYDPLAADEARRELKDKVVIVNSMEDCVAGADCVVLCNADPAFQALTPAHILQDREASIVFDCWRSHRECFTSVDGIRYIPFGCSDDDERYAKELSDLWGSPRDIGDS